jgi:hypothetical protein
MLNKLITKLIALDGLLSRHTWIAAIVFSVFWGVFLLGTGTIVSGFHLIDDHEMVVISRQLETNSPTVLAVDWIRTDFNIRFRPFYYVHRVFSVAIFGANFTALALLAFGLAVATSWLLYAFARQVGFKAIWAYLFVFLAFAGEQAAIWWRLGPSEPIGMFWLALSLYAMAKAIHQPGRYATYLNLLSAGALIIASLCKESFVVLIPVIILWELYLYKIHNNIKWVATIRAKIFKILFFAILCIGELFTIFFVVGANKIGYAGADGGSLRPLRILATLKQIFLSTQPLLLAAVIICLGGVLLYMYLNKSKHFDKTKLQQQFIATISVCFVMGSFIASQAVIYAKSGIYERYLNPVTIGTAFLAVFLIIQIKQLLLNKRVQILVTITLGVIVLITIVTGYAAAAVAAEEFAVEGQQLNAALATVSKQSSGSNNVIVIIADPALDYEASISTRLYLTIEADREVYIQPLFSKTEYSDFHKQLAQMYTQNLVSLDVANLADKSVIQAVFTYLETDQALSANYPSWFNGNAFERLQFGKYVVYSRK